MKLLVLYESGSLQIGERYEVSLELESINYANLLVGRQIVNCFIQEFETKQWIRCPTEKILRTLLGYLIYEQSEIYVLFRESNISPNQNPPQTKVNEAIEKFKTEKLLQTDISYTSQAVINLHAQVNVSLKAINTIDPFSSDCISDLDASSIVKLPCDDGINWIAVNSINLLEYITYQVFDLVYPYEIRVEVSEKGNYCVTLTKAVWLNYLTRGHKQSILFTDLIATAYGHLYRRKNELKILHANSQLWQNLKLFHYDLMHISNDTSVKIDLTKILKWLIL